MKQILFNTEMVKAILDGRKTTTRRAVKLNFERVYKVACAAGKWSETLGNTIPNEISEWYAKKMAKPPYKPGDVLYVRETFGYSKDKYHRRVYKADLEFPQGRPRETLENGKWKSPYAMTKEAARIFLRVTDIKAERLQAMYLADCLKEGVQLSTAEESDLVIQGIRARERFSAVWDGTVKKSDLCRYGWGANPWVWVISFERCEKET